MIINVNTRVDSLLYRRIADFKTKVDNSLRDDLKKQSDKIDWSTEKIETTLLKDYSFCKCGDRLIVQMSVEEFEDIDPFEKVRGLKDKTYE
jgi:hypothetical protein